MANLIFPFIDITTILHTCGGLLQIQQASARDKQTVGFVHYTLQEHMDEKYKNMPVERARHHADMANTMLTYLCLQNFQGKVLNRLMIPLRYPFLDYAARFWPAHAESAGDGLHRDLIEKLLSPSMPNLRRTWLRSAFPADLLFGQSDDIPLAFALAVAATQNARTILQIMAELGVSVHGQWTRLLSPLQFALRTWRNIHQDSLYDLFSFGISENSGLNRAWISTVLHDCDSFRAEHLFRAWLEKKHDVIKSSDDAAIECSKDSRLPNRCDTPLLSQLIGLRRFGETFKWLVGAGWEVNVLYSPQANATRHYTVLHEAIYQRSVEYVQLLVEAGSIVSGPWPGSSPLRLAVRQGEYNIVRILVNAGAAVHDQDSEGDTPLIAAIKNGEPSMVKMLLESRTGFDLSRRDLPDAMDKALENNRRNADEDDILAILVPHYFALDVSTPYFVRRLYRIFTRDRLAVVQKIVQDRRRTTDDARIELFLGLLEHASGNNRDTADLSGTFYSKLQLPQNLFEMIVDCLGLEESTEIAIDGQLRLLGPMIQCGNLPLLEQLLSKSLDSLSNHLYESLLGKALMFSQSGITKYLLYQCAESQRRIGRLALECYLLLQDSSHFFWKLSKIYARDRRGRSVRSARSARTYEWFTCQKLFYMCRRGDIEERLLLEQAFSRGVRPYDMYSLPYFPELRDHIHEEAALREIIVDALEDNSFDVKSSFAQLCDDGQGSWLRDAVNNRQEAYAVERVLRSILRGVR
jgi:hypothetical protein